LRGKHSPPKPTSDAGNRAAANWRKAGRSRANRTRSRTMLVNVPAGELLAAQRSAGSPKKVGLKPGSGKPRRRRLSAAKIMADGHAAAAEVAEAEEKAEAAAADAEVAALEAAEADLFAAAEAAAASSPTLMLDEALPAADALGEEPAKEEEEQQAAAVDQEAAEPQEEPPPPQVPPRRKTVDVTSRPRYS